MDANQTIRQLVTESQKRIMEIKCITYMLISALIGMYDG